VMFLKIFFTSCGDRRISGEGWGYVCQTA